MSEAHSVVDANRQIEQLVLRLEEQGALDGQFKRILQLPDDSHPDFVSEVVELFLGNTEEELQKIAGHLAGSPPEFGSVSQVLIKLKGSNETFGARALTDLCVEFQNACASEDASRCAGILQRQREALAVLQLEMRNLLELERRKKEMMVISGQQQQQQQH